MNNVESIVSTCTCIVDEHVIKHVMCFDRRQYRIDAEKAFNLQMMEAFKGKSQFPPIKTFKQSLSSTNSVFQDIEMAEDW